MVLIAVAVDIVFAALAIVGARRAMRKMLRPPAFTITTQNTSSSGASPIEPVYGKGGGASVP